MELPRPLRTMLATALVASLAAALLAALLWAFNPEEGGGLRFRPDAVPLADEAAADETPEDGGQATPGDGPGATASPGRATPSPDPATPSPDPTELIAAAPDPPATTVQVLDAGAGAQATARAAQVLAEEHGYTVVHVTSSRTDVQRTTIAYTDGHEAAAQALRARDERFAAIVPNPRFNPATDLHVLVGPDWPSG